MFINIRFFLNIFTVLVMAYIISAILFFTLPKKGIEYAKRNIFTTNNITNINLENIFLDKSTSKLAVKKAQRFLKTVKLLAVYDLGKDGYIIVQEVSSTKTHIIGKNESFKGYKLIEVSNKDVLFEKDNKKYKLSLEIKKNGV